MATLTSYCGLSSVPKFFMAIQRLYVTKMGLVNKKTGVVTQLVTNFGGGGKYTYILARQNGVWCATSKKTLADGQRVGYRGDTGVWLSALEITTSPFNKPIVKS